MNVLGSKRLSFIKSSKCMLLVLPIYILYVTVSYFIIGVSTGDIWDKLVNWSESKIK